MAQLLVRDLEDAVIQALKQKAAEDGTSVEEAHRRILRVALLSKKPKKGFKEFLLEMPDTMTGYLPLRKRSLNSGVRSVRMTLCANQTV